MWREFPDSKGDKVTLIKAILSSVPTYFFSISRAPVECKKIEGLFRSFLWKGAELFKGIHLVNWAKVTTLRLLGVLGIDHLRGKNFALLAKWVWMFEKDGSALWRSVVKNKFGENFMRDSLESRV